MTQSLLRNHTANYCVCKSLSQDSVLSYMSSVHIFTHHFLKIHFVLSLRLHLRFSSSLSLQNFSARILYVFVVSHIPSTWPIHLSLLDLITLIVFSEEYNLWSFSLYNFLLSPVTYSVLLPNILCSALKPPLILVLTTNKTTGKIVVRVSFLYVLR
jgi:hypothetical protein